MHTAHTHTKNTPADYTFIILNGWQVLSSEEENGLNSNEQQFTPRAASSTDWKHTRSNKYSTAGCGENPDPTASNGGFPTTRSDVNRLKQCFYKDIIPADTDLFKPHQSSLHFLRLVCQRRAADLSRGS